jgi:hypothetical protein
MRRSAFLSVVVLLMYLGLIHARSYWLPYASAAEATPHSPSVTLLEPPEGGIVYSGHPEFVWTSAAGADSMDGYHYDLYVSSDSDFTSSNVTASLLDTTHWELSPLSLGTRYWWKIISRDSLGTATPSATNSFYTYFPGDVNESHDLTAADIIGVVNYVFKSATLGAPECAADVNGVPNVTSSDIVALVAHVFRGGAAPAPGCLSDAPIFWPLSEGSYWVYELCSAGPCFDSAQRMEVVHRALDTAIVVGQPWWWSGTVTVRQQGPNVDWRWPDTGWSPFYRFEVGTWTRADMSLHCNDSVFVATLETDSIITPAGTFHDCLRIQSARHCSDGGMIAEWWAPGVGLVAWIEDSFVAYQYYYLTDYHISPD